MKSENAVCVVTGGVGGLGRAICDYFLERKARVIVADRDAEALQNLPDSFCCEAVDVCDPVRVKAMVQKIVKEQGRIDILVNCAGTIVSAPFVNVFSPDQMMFPYERFRQEMAINLDSVFIVTAAVVEEMVRRRTPGCIINISSICAHGNAGQTSYAAAKAGVNAMTVTWAKELGRMGIRCNAVAPGFIGTPSTHAALQDAHLKHIVENTPLRRLGDAKEVAQAVYALVENDFCNGVILDVNGGLTL
ncbi:MAG: SDR family oxidoreductase [Desulfovibrio sp.]|nr:SDR family oxidoreductase [Desulfovibrio sp.]